ncbi:unnamed protein product [Brassica oleracea]
MCSSIMSSFQRIPATGSADRTVKFWDLETFELIGSGGPEVLLLYGRKKSLSDAYLFLRILILRLKKQRPLEGHQSLSEGCQFLKIQTLLRSQGRYHPREVYQALLIGSV